MQNPGDLGIFVDLSICVALARTGETARSKVWDPLHNTLFIKWTLGLIVGHLWSLKWLSGCKLPRCKLSGWLVVITEVRSWVVIWLLVISLLVIIIIRSICRRWSIVWYGSSIFWEVS